MGRLSTGLVLGLCLFGRAPLYAQQAPKLPGQAHPKVDQKAVDEAIQRGVQYLFGRCDSLSDNHATDSGVQRRHELILLTLIHAGVDPEEPHLKRLLQYVLDHPLERTYGVSLQAMALERLDPVKYQWRIAQCAQFLADNQLNDGSWSYGSAISIPRELETDSPLFRREVATGSPVKGRTPAKVRAPRKIRILKRDSMNGECDNSNTQFAALGIRACAVAGIQFEDQLLKRALSHWEKTQQGDGGSGYSGWFPEPYGTMSAGGVGSLCIYRHLLKTSWKKDPRVLKGIQWVTDNFTVARHPGEFPKWAKNTDEGDQWWYYYYMYAVERAGILYDTEFFGKNEWYPLGTNELLRRQQSNGAWDYDVNTCFAILFLRRATQPLRIDVATGASSK